MSTASYSWPDFNQRQLPPVSDKMVIASPPGQYLFYRCVIDKATDVERNWDIVWKKILMPNGQLNLEQLKRELFDYSFLIQEAIRVYSYVSGGRLIKAAHTAQEVITAFNDYMKNLLEKKVDEELNKRLSS